MKGLYPKSLQSLTIWCQCSIFTKVMQNLNILIKNSNIDVHNINIGTYVQTIILSFFNMIHSLYNTKCAFFLCERYFLHERWRLYERVCVCKIVCIWKSVRVCTSVCAPRFTGMQVFANGIGRLFLGMCIWMCTCTCVYSLQVPVCQHVCSSGCRCARAYACKRFCMRVLVHPSICVRKCNCMQVFVHARCMWMKLGVRVCKKVHNMQATKCAPQCILCQGPRTQIVCYVYYGGGLCKSMLGCMWRVHATACIHTS